MGRRRYLGEVEVSVSVEEVLDGIDEEAILEYLGKTTAMGVVDAASLDELEWSIRHGKLAAAYATIEGWRTNIRITDDVRAKAYAEAARAGQVN